MKTFNEDISKRKIYLNCTNGLEWMDNFPKEDINFIRIQSTTIERKDYLKLIGDLDHNFLMYLALGYECHVYDCGTNRPYSKTIYQGIPLIKYILERRWLDLIPPNVHNLTRFGAVGHDVTEYYNHVYTQLFIYDKTQEKVKVKKKIDYYKRFLNTKELHLYGHSKSTSHDGDYSFYSQIAKTQL